MTTNLTLHGLGYIALPLEGQQRLQIWHPDLPRRENVEDSAIRCRNYASMVTVLKGVMAHRKYLVHDNAEDGAYDLLNRADGVVTTLGRVDLGELPEIKIAAGSFHRIAIGEYHRTIVEGTAVLLVQEIENCDAATNIVATHGTPFDTDFDANQLSQAQLEAIMIEAMTGVTL